MIEVFKTNITEEAISETIQKALSVLLPESYINFDLEDCDKILRIENCTVDAIEIIQILKQNGCECQLLN